MKSIEALRSSGMTILLVEQNASRAIGISDRVYVMQTGELSFSGSSAEAAEHSEIMLDYLGG